MKPLLLSGLQALLLHLIYHHSGESGLWALEKSAPCDGWETPAVTYVSLRPLKGAYIRNFSCHSGFLVKIRNSSSVLVRLYGKPRLRTASPPPFPAQALINSLHNQHFPVLLQRWTHSFQTIRQRRHSAIGSPSRILAAPSNPSVAWAASATL